ncbi:HAD superfamily hydrolase (TIGR01509 family) [Stackebrandtia albiflava]|uniref:D,D-heptose 1,7-bisphosphate phosphatase n=1 Tax=Stackebrandtia albiflava TaxID=406432 RepID=A0A562VA00_9ACTN|nr:HAD-IIIA family hydrolase [Stackebrandtia albiflava]TWJ14719.1 HAD superfamily hydrolase (TIGR01509 family) [Stackebrandtia albiflava]
MIEYTVVIPTVGRPGLPALLHAVADGGDHAAREIVVVDDRRRGDDLAMPELKVPTRLLRGDGRGPAAARNLGWRHATTPWVVFLDDDVDIGPDWHQRLFEDLAGQPAEVGAVTGRIRVPLPERRRPTDAERGTAALESARWITADIAYRVSVLEAVGGFDERFRRAFREDADLALRVSRAGYRVEEGRRLTFHPLKPERVFASVTAQAGNHANALMRAKHGRRWRQRIGEGSGMLGRYVLTTGLGLTALVAARRAPRLAVAAGIGWAGLTARFAAARIRSGPRDPAEVARMVVSSVLIPPAAVGARLAGELRYRRPRRPAAILFDRDDTLIVDVPYLSDPTAVTPVAGARDLLDRLRAAGIKVGVVSNQSGVAKGLISRDQLAAVEAAVRDALGPFDTWQVCPHDDGDGCDCRKPAPGMVRRAAADLGVDPADCVVIGDTGADVAAAGAAGARGILVPTGRTRPEEVEWAAEFAHVASDLRHAVSIALDGGA